MTGRSDTPGAFAPGYATPFGVEIVSGMATCRTGVSIATPFISSDARAIAAPTSETISGTCSVDSYANKLCI